jgi:agmatinase
MIFETKPYQGFIPAQSVQNNALHLIGLGYDGTACFRKGTKLGPNAIREVSDGIESYSPYQDKDLEDLKNLKDLGNIPFTKGHTEEEVFLNSIKEFENIFHGKDLKSDGIKILTLGGEHSVSYAPIKLHLEQFPDLVLLHLDAHADLRDGYEGYHYSHASVVRRSLDHFNDDHQLIQYGIRSGTRDEYQWMEEKQTLRKSLDEFIESVKGISPETPIYLTLDLDYFDPSFLPGTGTPEAGGEDFHSFIKLIKVLNQKNFIGADVVELSPPIDTTGNSSVFACKIVREIVLALA